MNPSARGHFLCAVLVAAISHAGVARADRGNPAAAEALFREGRAAADAGDQAKACKKFHESNRLDPAPGTVFNIADCEEKLGHVATAWTLFREVSQRLPSQDERSAMATARATALESRIPKLTLHLAPDAPAKTRVFRDGVELQAGSLDTALPVDPGKHVIAVEAPGHERNELAVELREGEEKRETLHPGKVAEERGEASSQGSTWRTVGYVLGGVGIVGLGVGAVTGIMVLDRKSTVDDNCDEDKRCNPTGADAAESGRTLGPISGVSLIAGAVALGAGAVLVLSSGGGERETPTAAMVLGPGQFRVQGRF